MERISGVQSQTAVELSLRSASAALRPSKKNVDVAQQLNLVARHEQPPLGGERAPTKLITAPSRVDGRGEAKKERAVNAHFCRRRPRRSSFRSLNGRSPTIVSYSPRRARDRRPQIATPPLAIAKPLIHSQAKI